MTDCHTRLVAKLTGRGSINSTHRRAKVGGTDLGVMWDDGDGGVLFACGDTTTDLGVDVGRPGGPGNNRHRHNVIFRSTTTDLDDGLRLEPVVHSLFGSAETFFPPLHPQWGCIPTSGFHLGERQYVSYMQVTRWDPRGPGTWDTAHSGLACSDDGGRHWRWSGIAWDNPDGTHPFQVQCFVPHGDWVYLFGTGQGRRNDGLHLARVRPDELDHAPAYEYWDGEAFGRGAQPLAIVPRDVGEPNVTYLGDRWVLTCSSGYVPGVYIRTAAAPTGPWSAPLLLTEMPGCYGGFQHPWSTGDTLHTAVSLWAPYNIFLARTQLPSEFDTGAGVRARAAHTPAVPELLASVSARLAQLPPDELAPDASARLERRLDDATTALAGEQLSRLAAPLHELREELPAAVPDGAAELLDIAPQQREPGANRNAEDAVTRAVDAVTHITEGSA